MTNIAPKQGSGLHSWLLTESRKLLYAGYPPDTVYNELMLAAKHSARTTQDIEIEIRNVIEGAREYILEHPNFRPSTRWRKRPPPRDPNYYMDRANRIDSRAPRLPVDELLVRKIIGSEEVFLDPGKGVEEFNYRLLFANIDFNIAACREVGKDYAIKPLSEWNYEETFPLLGYVVPSYFSDIGCSRSDLNVGERLFIVVEFDKGTPNDQWLLHHYLNRTNPAFWLIMLVWSGHRSVHGWYASYGSSEFKVRTFQRRASELGADQTCVSPSAWIRMPNGWNRKYSVTQEVLYFDVEKLGWQNDLVRREIL